MYIYINIIKNSIILFPLVALIISLPFFIWAYRKYGSFTLLRALILYSFSFYLLTAYFLVILPLPTFEEVAAMANPGIDLNPASFIIYYLKDRSIYAIMEPLFNIAILIPLGIYARYYFQYSFRRTVLLSFVLSLFFEITQLTGLYGIYPHAYRLFSVNDLMFNVIGGMVGFAIAGLLIKILPSREKMDEHSYKKGTTVSILRRSVALVIDYVVLGILVGIVSFLLDYAGIKTAGFGQDNFTLVVYILCIFIYFILICYLAKGQTVGKAIVKIQVVRGEKEDLPPSLWSLLLRYVLLYYLIVPVVFMLFYLLNLTGTAPESQLDFILGEVVVVFAVCVLFGINFIYAVFSRKHRLVYESMSGTKVISLVKETVSKQ